MPKPGAHYFRLLCELVVIASALGACGNDARDPARDLTGRLERLGNPYQTRYKGGAEVYARNIWDMQAYQGSIYLGAGNSSNDGPAPNAGPVPIIKFDPETQRFIQEGWVDDEQVDVYQVIDGDLYIPGHDPRESWDWGNFYRRANDGTWSKYRNIPGGVHTYSLAWFDAKLFGALNLKDDGAGVSISKDMGNTWALVSVGRSRVYGFLNVDNKLYAVKRFPSSNQWDKMNANRRAQYSSVFEYKSSDIFMPRKDIMPKMFFPKTSLRVDKNLKIVRPLAVGAKSVYIGAYTHNDHQSNPFGVYIATSLEEGRVQVDRIPIPDQYRPWDLLIKAAYLYMLIEDNKGDRTVVKVIRSPVDKLMKWSEVFQFSAPTFARSFEVLNDDFYFGLGCEIENPKQWRQEELSYETGQIFRIRHAVTEP
jgi:hypothetical protein